MIRTIDHILLPRILCAIVLAAMMPHLRAEENPRPQCGTKAFHESPGTQRMAKRLETLYAEMSVDTNFFGSSARVKMLRNYLAKQQGSGNRDVVRFEWDLATELLRAGQTTEAIEWFQKLKQFVNRNRPLLHEDFISQVHHQLAFSYIRLGEQENCISQHSADSCLFPIKGTGIHTVPRGSRAAIEEYLALLEDDPNDLRARWLLNVAHMTLGEYPKQVAERWRVPPAAFESDYDIKRFPNVASALGLDVVGLAGGSVVEDFDRDGYLDIMASSWGFRDQLRYFHNNGDGTFSDCSDQAGLRGSVGGLNLVHADFNNDGHTDVFVLRGAWLEDSGRLPNSLLRNNGDGTFDDVTEEAGVLSFHPTQTAAWGDYNNDGWIDLFIGNESFSTQGRHPCELYRNNRNGTFTDVAAEVGVDFAGGWVKGATWGDYDNDGLPDLYLSSLMSLNVLFHNEGRSEEGDWRFEDVTAKAGVAEPRQSFPVWFWDFNNDGWLDLFVSGYRTDVAMVAADYLDLPHEAEVPRLYRNNGNGTFTDVAAEAKLDTVLWTMGCNFGDLDNDGYLDLYAGTGDPSLESLVPNRMFRNSEGRFFQDVTTSGGFGHLQKGHGVSFADIDNDGDQDIYSVIGGAFTGDIAHNVLFENPGHGGRWITLKLEGVQSNRSAIGARIKVRVKSAEGPRDIYATVSTGGSFGASSLQQEIGLGQALSINAIQVTWPTSGTTQTFTDVGMDQIVRIVEGEPAPLPLIIKPFKLVSGAEPSTDIAATEDSPARPR